MADKSECTRLRRLLFALLWRELRTVASRDERLLRTIRRAKRALPTQYRKALPRMEG
jgi:hypothetical protein